MNKDKKMISLEISNTLREALRIKAYKENTSISNLIRLVLETSLKDEIVEAKNNETI